MAKECSTTLFGVLIALNLVELYLLEIVFAQFIFRILKKVSGTPLCKPEVNFHVMHVLVRLIVSNMIQQKLPTLKFTAADIICFC